MQKEKYTNSTDLSASLPNGALSCKTNGSQENVNDVERESMGDTPASNSPSSQTSTTGNNRRQERRYHTADAIEVLSLSLLLIQQES